MAATARTRKPAQQPVEHRLLMTATMCLLAGGAVMVYSASSAPTVLSGGGDGTTYLVKYLMYGAVGLVAMNLLARNGLAVVRRVAPLLVLVSFCLSVATLFPHIGIEVNGAKRWLGAGPVQFQPSELLKVSLILYAASVIGADPKIARNLRTLGPVMIVAGPSVVLVGVLQKDLGTAIVISLTLCAMFVAAGLPLRQLGLIAGVALLVVALLVLVEPYRMSRLTSFINPSSDPGGTGFQALQGRISVGSGGLLGMGIGAGPSKLFYLPEAHTDFILAVIGQEIGLVGIVAVLALYGMIGYAGLQTAAHAKGAYAKLLAAGLTALILCQALLNCYAVLGLAPLTGVPLPFISSGSTSLIVLLCAMGLLLNIASGGSAHLVGLRGGRKWTVDANGESKRDARADRGGRDGRARGAGARSRRRAAG